MRLRNDIVITDIPTAHGAARGSVRVRGIDAMFGAYGVRIEQLSPIAIEIERGPRTDRVTFERAAVPPLVAFAAAPLMALIVTRLARRRERNS